MTAEDKAKELIEVFRKQLNSATPTLNRPHFQARACALICVDEMRKFSREHTFSIREDNDFLDSLKSFIENS